MTQTSAHATPHSSAATPAPQPPLIEVTDLQVHFPVRAGILFDHQVAAVRAVDGLSFSLHRGEVLGLVGESGCGKSTTGRAVARLERPTAGSIRLDGTDISRLRGTELRRVRRRVQMIFQDPFASLNPRMTIGQLVGEPLGVHRLVAKDERPVRVAELLRTVGLDPASVSRYPHEFSGGQRQRIGIARALAVEPEVIVADEPISALDVSIQAQVVNLLADLRAAYGLAFLFIAHDLAVVRHVSDRVAVMYLGKIVELADRDDLYAHALHPYTQALLSAVPVPDPVVEQHREQIILHGDVPSPMSPPSGCRFRTRCWKAQEVCAEVEPPLVELATRHWTACHFPDVT
ncbi:ABC transporter ATP-binding protein [Jiangella asiatica]|uniref:ATP-binding cassette domain-containing protein n=1 Tax=Jiangella asiatica TaxID=2530372 RepID=A0A4R5DJM7_9ACTN|nr:oligopeptide/dipeptide ABC transporter ATP-binding protein [Jiangella asiatica]TDE12174.1 ATP-binding cassette domain-containing protein [Jiangella asiatica]